VVMAVAGVVLLAMAGLAVGLAVGLNEKDSKSSASAPFAVDIAFTANGNPGDYDDNERATMLGVIATAAGLQLEDAALTVVSGSVIVTASFPIESQSLAQTALTALATNLPNATSLQSALATAGLTVTVLSAPTATTRASTDPVTSGAAPPPSSSPSPSPSPSSTSTVAVAGRWISAYSSFVVTNTMWLSVSLSSGSASEWHITQHTSNTIIAQNSMNNTYNPGQWSKFRFHGLTSGGFSYCQVAYDAASEQAAIDAIDAVEVYDASDAATGCGSFNSPHSVLTKYVNPVKGAWASTSSTFDISDDTWFSSASWGNNTFSILFYIPGMIIAQNAADDAYNPSKWSKFQFHDLTSGGFSYCQTVFSGETWRAALSEVPIYNASDAATGCGSFNSPHSVLTVPQAAP